MTAEEPKEDEVPSKEVKQEDEEDNRIKIHSAMQTFALGLDDEARERERRAINDSEINIDNYEAEPEFEKILTDFYIPPHPSPHDRVDPGPPIPMNFYDNEDGFWDAYIQKKQDRMGANPMIMARKFFKH